MKRSSRGSVFCDRAVAVVVPKQNTGNSPVQREPSNRSVILGHCESEEKVWRERDTSQNRTAFGREQGKLSGRIGRMRGND